MSKLGSYGTTITDINSIPLTARYGTTITFGVAATPPPAPVLGDTLRLYPRRVINRLYPQGVRKFPAT